MLENLGWKLTTGIHQKSQLAGRLFGFHGNLLNLRFIVEKNVASADDGEDILGVEPEDQSRTNGESVGVFLS
jgi:hypothetical protein